MISVYVEHERGAKVDMEKVKEAFAPLFNSIASKSEFEPVIEDDYSFRIELELDHKIMGHEYTSYVASICDQLKSMNFKYIHARIYGSNEIVEIKKF